MSDGVVCSCCNDGIQETIEHLFIRCSFSKSLWGYFEGTSGVDSPFLKLKDTVYKWWNLDAFAKLKSVIMVFVAKCGKEKMP